jgi:thiamine-phosphate pyrophosphorylase
MLFGGICFITDRRLSALSIEDTVKAVLDAGVKWVQYREKELTRREIYLTAERLRRITQEYGAVFIINDHADIALSVGADGVHLGQDDLPLKEARKVMKDKIIGISTHDLEQAKEAEEGGAEYIGFGPVFSTSTKKAAGTPRGIEVLKKVTDAVSIPVVAIGGIKLDNLEEVIKAGAEAVAVASGILTSDNIYRTAREFVKIVNKYST